MRRRALITGGGTGIGRGIALALARRGVDLALVGRRPEPLQAVVHQATAQGVRAIALPTDLADTNERAGLLARVHAAVGPIDILVNSAGVLGGGNLDRLPSTEIEQAVAVNLLAPIELTRQCLPDLRHSKGAVILVGSTMSYVPLPSASVYAANKSGLRAFGEAVRYELESLGVRLLLAYPPGTNTAMVRGMAKAAGQQGYPLHDPELVGERIVTALAAGRREVHWLGGERALILLRHLAPGVVRMVLRTQRRRFERMMGVGRS